MKSHSCPSSLDDNHAAPTEPSISAETLIPEMHAAQSWPEALRLRNEALLANLHLVEIALRRLRAPSWAEDLKSVGTVALLEAVGTFDETRGVPFVAYALPLIRFRMADHLAAHGESGFVVGHGVGRELYRVRRRLWLAGREPDRMTTRQIAAVTGEEFTVVRRIRHLLTPCASVDFQPSGPEGETLGAVGTGMGATDGFGAQARSPAELTADRTDLAELTSALERLPWRSRFIVERIYGLDGKGERQQADVAACLGISRQRVSQLAGEALVELRHAMEA